MSLGDNDGRYVGEAADIVQMFDRLEYDGRDFSVGERLCDKQPLREPHKMQSRDYRKSS
jgi:hypothetical protein